MKGNDFERPPLVDSLATPRFSFPLSLQYAKRYAGDRMALVGDAAHRIHPMAGQGLNAGMTDVAYLANAIVAALKSGQDIGSYEQVLKEYERQSKNHANLIIGGVEFI